MSTQTNNLVLVENGVSRTLDATNDSLSIGASTTFTKSLTASAGLAVTGNASVSGDLTVTGDIVSRGSSNLLIQDAIIDLATSNSATVATPGGFTVQMNRNSGFTAGNITTFVAGVVAVSAPTLTYTDATSSTLLVANDIIAVTGSNKPSNDGLYVVASVSGASFPQTLTLKGIGGTSVPGYTPFLQNQVASDTGNTATAYKIDLAVGIFADGSASFKDGSGTDYPKGTFITAYKANAQDSDFTGNGAYSTPSATQTLQAAYDGGATITTAGGTAFSVTLANGGFTVEGGGAVDFGSTGTDVTGFSVGTSTFSVAATGSVSLNSTGGGIGIGTNADAQSIGIGTGAAARTITVGNTTGATAVLLKAGTGASSIEVTGAGTFDLTAGTGQINLATNATDHATTIGSITGTSAFTSRSGTGAMTHTAGGAYDVNATGNVTIDSSGGTIGIGTDAVAQSIGIGTGAAARTITVGNATGATSVVLNAGTGNIDIGTGAQARTTNIATGAAAQVVTIGSTNTTSSLTLNAGTGVITLGAWTRFSTNAGFSATAGETISSGQAVYAKYDGGSSSTRYYVASNNDATTGDIGRNVHAICLVGGNAGDTIYLGSVPGLVINTNTTTFGTADIGLPVYLDSSSNPGKITKTAPTASGSTVFKLGYLQSDTGGVAGTGGKILFQPQFVAKIP